MKAEILESQNWESASEDGSDNVNIHLEKPNLSGSTELSGRNAGVMLDDFDELSLGESDFLERLEGCSALSDAEFLLTA